MSPSAIFSTVDKIQTKVQTEFDLTVPFHGESISIQAFKTRRLLYVPPALAH
jgi:hypothetical protein